MRRFEPTPDQRRTVKTMAGFGIPHTDIAPFIGIDTKTLRKHFREELDRGMTEANAKVAQSLFHMATQGKNVAAAIFWMKARGGWREKQEVDANLRTDMRAIHVVTGVPRAMDDMTDEELMRIAAGGRRRIAGGRRADDGGGGRDG
jgi:hypothetical protein